MGRSTGPIPPALQPPAGRKRGADGASIIVRPGRSLSTSSPRHARLGGPLPLPKADHRCIDRTRPRPLLRSTQRCPSATTACLRAHPAAEMSRPITKHSTPEPHFGTCCCTPPRRQSSIDNRRPQPPSHHQNTCARHHSRPHSPPLTHPFFHTFHTPSMPTAHTHTPNPPLPLPPFTTRPPSGPSPALAPLLSLPPPAWHRDAPDPDQANHQHPARSPARFPSPRTMPPALAHGTPGLFEQLTPGKSMHTVLPGGHIAAADTRWRTIVRGAECHYALGDAAGWVVVGGVSLLGEAQHEAQREAQRKAQRTLLLWPSMLLGEVVWDRDRLRGRCVYVYMACRSFS